MTTRYVGPGGNDANTGLSWAQRKLTLNGVEDTPVVAGDWVWVGPGVYRETLTVDVSGSAGSPITYAGDYTGANTDGVGGVVRITGSDNDQTATRANCIAGNYADYRTFSGIVCDTTTGPLINLAAGLANYSGNWVIDECLFWGAVGQVALTIVNPPTGGTDNAATVQNCAFIGGTYGIQFSNTNSATSTNLVQNCLFLAQAAVSGGAGRGINIQRVGGGTVKNCTFVGCGSHGLIIGLALPAGYTAWTVNNCMFYGCATALAATAVGEIAEDYNTIYGCTTARTNVAVGANSLACPPLFDARWFFELVNGGRMLSPFDLGAWSQLIDVAGTAPTATDMRGTGAIGGQREWGSLEYDSTLKIAGGGTGGAVRILPLRGSIG